MHNIKGARESGKKVSMSDYIIACRKNVGMYISRRKWGICETNMYSI